MRGKDYLFTKLDGILKDINAEQAELVYTGKDLQLTRFANNYIHQNIAELDAELHIKIVNGKKVSVAAINSFEPEKIKATVDKLVEMMEFQPEDPNFVSLPSPSDRPYPEVHTYDAETAECTPEKRAGIVKIVCDQAERFHVLASGQCSTTVNEVAVVNSLGIRAYNTSTEAQLLSMVIDQMEGFSNYNSRSISGLNPEIVAEESVSKCVNSRNPIEIEAGTYPVVLQSYGVAQLLEYLCFMNFNGKDFIEGRSCITGKIGEKITGDLITIYNDPFDPEGLPMPFDMEGVPKEKLILVENGIARGVSHNTYTANRINTKSNGNSISPANKTPYPLNISMKAGDAGIDRMVAGIERGLCVTRLNYLNIVDPKQTIHTGLTRGGTFLIENGKITKPVYNLRFTDSILKLFSEVTMISKERRLGGEILLPALAPALKIEKFRFTGVTRPIS